MATRKIVTRSGQRFGSALCPQWDAAAIFPPDAKILAARLALVAESSPGAFYLVSGIIEGILSVVAPADIDEKVH